MLLDLAGSVARSTGNSLCKDCTEIVLFTQEVHTVKLIFSGALCILINVHKIYLATLQNCVQPQIVEYNTAQ